MKEIRITFSSDDFAAVTSHMIDLGVRFTVEPVPTDEDGEAGSAPAPSRRREARRKPGRGGRKGGTAESGGGGESSGAARLRAMVERNRTASTRPDDQRSGGDDFVPDAGAASDTAT